MIRTLALTAALAASLSASTAFAQMTSSHAAATSALPTPAYTRTAAQSDEFEIASAKVALHMSQNASVKTFAQRMIQDHTQSTMMIKAALREGGHAVPPAPPLTSAQDHMLADLRKSGAGFDHAYVTQQLEAHQMALSVHEGYASSGTDPALRRTAGKIVPVVEAHLQMLHDMQSHMG